MYELESVALYQTYKNNFSDPPHRHPHITIIYHNLDDYDDDDDNNDTAADPEHSVLRERESARQRRAERERRGERDARGERERAERERAGKQQSTIMHQLAETAPRERAERGGGEESVKQQSTVMNRVRLQRLSHFFCLWRADRERGGRENAKLGAGEREREHKSNNQQLCIDFD